MKKDFLTVWDLSSKEISLLIERSLELKRGGDKFDNFPLKGKSAGLIFEKSSTRTRVSFEVAIYQLGGQPIFLNSNDIQLKRGESVADTARVLSGYLDCIIIRTYAHERIIEFAGNSSVPVINGLTDKHHPCQVLADIMTIREKRGKFEGASVAYIGDGNNVANSLLEISSLLGIHLIIACPEGYEPDAEVLDRTRSTGKNEIILLKNPKEAVGAADVIYTDVWISMGDNESDVKKKEKFRKYQINDELLSCAKRDVIVLHCLPAHRGEEITSEVLDGPKSAVFDQSENRLHTQKALLELLVASKED